MIYRNTPKASRLLRYHQRMAFRVLEVLYLHRAAIDKVIIMSMFLKNYFHKHYVYYYFYKVTLSAISGDDTVQYALLQLPPHMQRQSIYRSVVNQFRSYVLKTF